MLLVATDVVISVPGTVVPVCCRRAMLVIVVVLDGWSPEIGLTLFMLAPFSNPTQTGYSVALLVL